MPYFVKLAITKCFLWIPLVVGAFIDARFVFPVSNIVEIFIWTVRWEMNNRRGFQLPVKLVETLRIDAEYWVLFGINEIAYSMIQFFCEKHTLLWFGCRSEYFEVLKMFFFLYTIYDIKKYFCNSARKRSYQLRLRKKWIYSVLCLSWIIYFKVLRKNKHCSFQNVYRSELFIHRIQDADLFSIILWSR